MKKKEEGTKKPKRISSPHAGFPPHNRVAVLLISQQNNSCRRISQPWGFYGGLFFFLNFHSNRRKGKNLPNAPAATTASGSSLANTSSSAGSNFPVSFFLLETQKSTSPFFLDDCRGTFWIFWMDRNPGPMLPQLLFQFLKGSIHLAIRKPLL